ncbi:Heat shock protein 105 kDa [Hypsibius exemplaris]|uniref:Heat shock protein 105 kDa n=1 Tax=Hypsibius exemplaris TaxID=2072580 RepID=A0A1W0WHV2_HYPEX|nr:Heat shock protein 105 kDa [Hypsibius exemplaris]
MGGVFQRQKSKDTTQKYPAPRTSRSQLFDFAPSSLVDLPEESRKMSVIGIDLGTQSCYVATARSGGIELILNDYSMRDTPSAVAFHEKNRSMGVAARNNLVGNLTSTVYNFKRLLGKNFNDAAVQEELKYLSYKVHETNGGGVGITTTYLGKETEFVPEQICGMLLGKLKAISEADLKIPVTDCVISVPAYYTDVERRALLAAAQIAGLNVLRLMNDTTAVALSYGLYSQELPEGDQPPLNVVFLDVGYCSTQLASVAYNKGKFKVLNTVTDPDLGGRNLDYALVQHFAEEFRGKYKIDVLSNKRATIRLRDECEKLKKMMSSIANEIPLNIECFMNDKDVSGKMKREDFEVLIADYLQRTETRMREMLDSLKGAEVHRVEIVGAGVRVPAIKALVKKVFGIDPTTSLNQDEAVARGCAIQCAILSPTVKVKDFAIGDVCPYGIELRWPADRASQAGALEVFPRNHAIPFAKVVTFNRSEPFQLEACYSAAAGAPKDSSWIGKFRILDVKATPGEISTKVRIKSRIGLNGLFSVTNAYREEVVLVEEDAATVQIQPMETDEAVAAAGKDGESQERPDSSKMDTDEPQENPEKQKKTKKQSKQIELRIEAEYREYPAKTIQAFIEQENEMSSQDKAEKEKAHARNALEEYIYEARDKVNGDHADYVAESDREKFSTLLREAEDWLYSDGEDQPKSSYSAKLHDLQSHGAPITARYKEAQERPHLFQEMSRYMQLTRKAVDAFEAGDEKLAHIDAKDMDKVIKTVDEKQRWLDEKMNAQSKRALHLEPVVAIAQIKKEKEEMERLVNPILNKPKPKPVPKPEPPKEEPKTADAGDAGMDTDAPMD